MPGELWSLIWICRSGQLLDPVNFGARIDLGYVEIITAQLAIQGGGSPTVSLVGQQTGYRRRAVAVIATARYPW